MARVFYMSIGFIAAWRSNGVAYDLLGYVDEADPSDDFAGVLVGPELVRREEIVVGAESGGMQAEFDPMRAVGAAPLEGAAPTRSGTEMRVTRIRVTSDIAVPSRSARISDPETPLCRRGGIRR